MEGGRKPLVGAGPTRTHIPAPPPGNAVRAAGAAQGGARPLLPPPPLPRRPAGAGDPSPGCGVGAGGPSPGFGVGAAAPSLGFGVGARPRWPPAAEAGARPAGWGARGALRRRLRGTRGAPQFPSPLCFASVHKMSLDITGLPQAFRVLGSPHGRQLVLL